MTIQQLRYVIKIVECGSITEAARQLFISQPSLSAAVKELETELGIEIFHRTTRGITLSADGTEFLSYARQILEQTQLLEQRYLNKKPSKQLCSVSTQHYAFAVNAFVNLISGIDANEYEFTLRETRTYEIIEDVANFRSEIGIIYFSGFNERVMQKLLKENHLIFQETAIRSSKPVPMYSSVLPILLQGRNPSLWRIWMITPSWHLSRAPIIPSIFPKRFSVQRPTRRRFMSATGLPCSIC